MKMEQTECSETSAYEIQTPGNYPEEGIKYSEHGESLKSRKLHPYGEETARHLRLFEKLRIDMKMEQTESSETSGYKIETAGNYPEESIKHPKICLKTLHNSRKIK